MKLRNKKTGEIGNLLPWVDYKTKKEMSHFAVMLDNREEPLSYNSLAELTNEWEDYEEAKGYWYYDTTSAQVDKLNHNEDKEIDSSIGNCFGTKEEAEKAVEKLKAWKRLKDKGFRFVDFSKGSIEFKLDEEYSEFTYNGYDEGCEFYIDGDVQKDLELLFGGDK